MGMVHVTATAIILVQDEMVIIAVSVAVLQIMGQFIMAKAVTQVTAVGAATKAIPGITPVGITAVGNMTGITVLQIVATGIAVMGSPIGMDEDRAVTADSTMAMVTTADGSIMDTVVMNSPTGVDADMVVGVDTDTAIIWADVIIVTTVTSSPAITDMDVTMVTTPMENTTASAVRNLLIAADEGAPGTVTVITPADDITVTNSLIMADMVNIMVTTLTDDITVIITAIADMTSHIAAEEDTAVGDTVPMLGAGTTGIVGTRSPIAVQARIMVTKWVDNITVTT